MSDKNIGTKRYKTSCPYCKKEIYVQRSMGMIAFGMDFVWVLVRFVRAWFV